jgi:hypothetical protein
MSMLRGITNHRHAEGKGLRPAVYFLFYIGINSISGLHVHPDKEKEDPRHKHLKSFLAGNNFFILCHVLHKAPVKDYELDLELNLNRTFHN